MRWEELQWKEREKVRRAANQKQWLAEEFPQTQIRHRQRNECSSPITRNLQLPNPPQHSNNTSLPSQEPRTSSAHPTSTGKNITSSANRSIGSTSNNGAGPARAGLPLATSSEEEAKGSIRLRHRIVPFMTGLMKGLQRTWRGIEGVRVVGVVFRRRVSVLVLRHPQQQEQQQRVGMGSAARVIILWRLDGGVVIDTLLRRRNDEE